MVCSQGYSTYYYGGIWSFGERHIRQWNGRGILFETLWLFLSQSLNLEMENGSGEY